MSENPENVISDKPAYPVTIVGILFLERYSFGETHLRTVLDADDVLWNCLVDIELGIYGEPYDWKRCEPV